MTKRSSRITGFYKLSRSDRLESLTSACGLDEATRARLAGDSDVPFELIDRLVENAVASFAVPLGVATNMIVDSRDVFVPMATEESSVIAAISNAAKDCRDTGGFVTSTTGPEMIAQIQLVAREPWHVKALVLERRAEIAEICRAADPMLADLGGGFRDLEARVVDTGAEALVVVHLIVDTRDAMGANAVNTMAEAVGPRLAEWTGAQSHLRILSNLADRRLVRTRARWRRATIGADAVDGVARASRFADADPYRAATHNKGMMNGITALTLATGNDTRAIEAGAHAYAARTGRYRALSSFEVTQDGDLVGTAEVPCALGLVGGATRAHPMAQAALAVLQPESADHFSRIAGAVGLAQNFAALRALATTGIQAGHMKLHAQNVAIAVGAAGEEVAQVAARLHELGTVRQDVAERVLAEIRSSGSG